MTRFFLACLLAVVLAQPSSAARFFFEIVQPPDSFSRSTALTSGVPFRLIFAGKLNQPFVVDSVKLLPGEVEIRGRSMFAVAGIEEDFAVAVEVPGLPPGNQKIKVVAPIDAEEVILGETIVAVRPTSDLQIRITNLGLAVPSSNDPLRFWISGIAACTQQPTVKVLDGKILLDLQPVTGCENVSPPPPPVPISYFVSVPPVPAGRWQVIAHSGSRWGNLELEVLPARTVLSERFEVSVEWVDQNGQRGSGRLAEPPSADSALFYFFSANNWELMVKVFDQCAVNNHAWVYAAASTDVEYHVVIRELTTNRVFRIDNPLGTRAVSTASTTAFPCAP